MHFLERTPVHKRCLAEMLNLTCQSLRIQSASAPRVPVVKPANDEVMLELDWHDIIIFLSNNHLSTVRRFRIKYRNIEDNQNHCVFFILIYSITVVPTFPSFALVHPACPPSHSQSPHRCLCPGVIHTCSLTNPFPFFSPVPLPSDSCQSVPCFHVPGFVLLIS